MNHLKEISYTRELHELCGRIRAAQPSINTFLELEAFIATRTPHDARRLANALRHVEHRQDLAANLETIIWKASKPGKASLWPTGAEM